MNSTEKHQRTVNPFNLEGTTNNFEVLFNQLIGLADYVYPCTMMFDSFLLPTYCFYQSTGSCIIARVGKFMTQCQKPWINPGFITSCHKQVLYLFRHLVF